MLHYENLGLCKDGEAGKMIDEGHVELGGKVPVNVSGGLLVKRSSSWSNWYSKYL